MAWEIEYEHIDLVEMEHVTGFIERTVRTRSGEAARHIHKVLLGTDGLSTTRGAGSGNLQLSREGVLLMPDGKREVDVCALQKAMLAKLNAMHAAGRAYSRRKRVPIFPAKR